MAFDAHKNLAFSTVATAPSPAASGASLTVATGDGSKFPQPSTDGPFNVTIAPANATRAQLSAQAEIARCTARVGDVLTIARAAEGPNAARPVLVGDEIWLSETAKTLTDIEATAVASGTSFPGSPTDGQWFERTDRRVVYEYNATVSRWLSVDLKYVPFTQSRFVNASGSTGVWGWIPLFEDVYIDSFYALIRTGATNNASNFWTVNFNVQDVSTSGGSVVASVNSSGGAASTNLVYTASYATVVAAATHPSLLVNITKTGTPSAPDFAFGVTLRSAG